MMPALNKRFNYWSLHLDNVYGNAPIPGRSDLTR